MDEIRVYVKGGYIRANRSDNDDYPGIEVEFVPENYDGSFTPPRVLFEQPKDREDIQCRALFWEDKNNEDFTKEIEWEIKKGLTEEQIKAIEDLGWSFNDDKTSIQWYSPAGEDYCIEADEPIELIDKIIDEYFRFDIDEHIKMWLEAKNNGVSGVPSARELVEDAREIESMLEKLHHIVSDVETD